MRWSAFVQRSFILAAIGGVTWSSDALGQLSASAAGSLTVVVVDRDRGNSLEMSLVRLVRGQRDSLSHTTDSAGVATFESLDSGSYQLKVLRIGYRRFDASITLPAGCRRKVIVQLQQQRCDLAPDCMSPVHEVDVRPCRPDA